MQGFSIKLLIYFLLIFVFQQESWAQKKKKKVSTPTYQDSIVAEKYFLDAEKYFILEDYAKAYSLFEKSLEVIPTNSAANYKIAQVLYYEKDFQNALKYSLKAKDLSPENQFYFKLIAESYKALGDLTEAAKTYEEMLSNIEGSENNLPDLALIYLFIPDYQKALDTYNRWEDYYGVSPEVTFQKQNIYLKTNDVDGAAKEAIKLYSAFPSQYEYLYNLVKIYFSNGREKEALPHIEEFIFKNPDSPEPYLALYELYTKTGDFDKANEYLLKSFESSVITVDRKVEIISGKILELPNIDVEKQLGQLLEISLENYPENANLLAVYGDYYLRIGNKESALEKYAEAAGIDGSNYNVWQNILSICFDLQKYAEAIDYSERAIEYFPNQGIIFYMNGTAHLIEGNHEEAVESFESSKNLSKNNADLLAQINAQLGDAYNGLQDHTRSDEAYEAALNYNPDFDHVLNNYSYFLSLRGEKLELAKKMSTKLIKRNPDNPTFLDTHAWVLFNVKEYKEALRFIEKAAVQDPSATILEHYGDILFKLGRIDEAVEQWEKAKGLDSSSELIDKKIADRKLYE
ncbi:MAG: tetratricopeptide repeat protein [Bacteroidota bacterium]